MSDELSGDTRLSTAQRLKYLWNNILRNTSVSRCGLKPKSWSLPSNAYDEWVSGNASPLRVLSEAFIVCSLPHRVEGRTVRVLDIGCGSGRSCTLLAQAGFSGHYTGLDLDDRFDHIQTNRTDFKIDFIRGDVHSVLPNETYDVIISNSALEHIPNDMNLPTRFNDLLEGNGLQIHILPGPGALYTYLWHGFRQYSLSAIAQRFGVDNTDVRRLGGFFSFITHVILITVLEMLLGLSVRTKAPKFYGTILKSALRLDVFFPFPAIGYVVMRKRV